MTDINKSMCCFELKLVPNTLNTERRSQSLLNHDSIPIPYKSDTKHQLKVVSEDIDVDIMTTEKAQQQTGVDENMVQPQDPHRPELAPDVALERGTAPTQDPIRPAGTIPVEQNAYA